MKTTKKCQLPGSHLVLIAPVVINKPLIIRVLAENHMAMFITLSGHNPPAVLWWFAEY